VAKRYDRNANLGIAARSVTIRSESRNTLGVDKICGVVFEPRLHAAR
jgi:hypothetical protein